MTGGRSLLAVGGVCLALAAGCGTEVEVERHQDRSPTGGSDVSATGSGDAAPDRSVPGSAPKETPPEPDPTTSEGPRRPTDKIAAVFTPLPALERARVEAFGIRTFATAQWEIVTDLPPDEVEELLLFAADLWPALQTLGGRSIAPTGRIRAYVMAAPERFHSAGLVPLDLPEDFHGRIAGSEFWMRAGSASYYRRHLFAHEAVHVFLSQTWPESNRWRIAKLEGIAEWFATHRRTPTGYRFAVFPDRREFFKGFGRIERLQALASDWPALQDVYALTSRNFAAGLDPYALVWGLEQLRASSVGQDRHESVVGPYPRPSPTERIRWEWLATAIDYGINPGQVAPQFHDRDWSTLQAIKKAAGWQQLAFPSEAARIRIEATGECTIAFGDEVYESFPSGIRVDYFGGHPVGTFVVASAIPDGARYRWSEPTAIGKEGVVMLEPGALLFGRINCVWTDALRGSGRYDVRVAEAEATAN